MTIREYVYGFNRTVGHALDYYEAIPASERAPLMTRSRAIYLTMQGSPDLNPKQMTQLHASSNEESGRIRDELSALAAKYNPGIPIKDSHRMIMMFLLGAEASGMKTPFWLED